MTELPEMITAVPVSELASKAPPIPNSNPIKQPITEMITASSRNCSQDVPFACADRHADADLAGAFGDRDQHDVHDADAADQQRYRSDRAEQQRHDPRAFCGRIRCGGKVAQEEIVIHALAYPVPLAQQIGHGFFHFRHDFLGGGLHHHHAYRTRKLRTVDLALRGGERNDDGVILVAPIHALAFERQSAENDERALLDAESLADRVFVAE